MTKMRRFDNGGEIGLDYGGPGSGASKSGPYMAYGNPTDITPGVSNKDTLNDMGRPIVQSPSYQSVPTPADHFTNLPSGSSQQFNAMRSVVGLPSMGESGSDDNAANRQKAIGMLKSVVGLTPNDNNYSLQDAINQLKGQGASVLSARTPSMGSSMPDNGPPPVRGYYTPDPNEGPSPEMMERFKALQARSAPESADQENALMERFKAQQARSAPESADQENALMARFKAMQGMKKGGGVKAYAKGGKVKAYAKGGSVSASSRADGCAQRGKTRGTMR